MASDITTTFTIGLDYGTASVRAVVVSTIDGVEVGMGEYPYRHGHDGVVTDPTDPNLARQHPRDYLQGAVAAITESLARSNEQPGFFAEAVVGIGVDTTGSSPMPIDVDGVPLAVQDRFADDPAAMCWLWKDHTAHTEADEITERVAADELPYLGPCGGVYSSEWYWAKLVRFLRSAPTEVVDATAGWVELADMMPAFLAGQCLGDLKRGICAAGHKAMYATAWGGLPSAAFLDSIEPGLSRFRHDTVPVTSDVRIGGLTKDLAMAMGLPVGIAIAAGAFDAHMGAVGAGVRPGTLVKVIGTSTCDTMVVVISDEQPDVAGLCGMVPGSITPDQLGLEAGQSAVGDIFAWFVANLNPVEHGGAEHGYERLSEAAGEVAPGVSGLLSLDWHNGNRSVLVDHRLTGCMVGQTLATTAPEIFRALIEATGFGARRIIDQFENAGVAIERITACGGISQKNPLLLQIYADITGRPIDVSASAQTCALGAAIFAAVAAGAHHDIAKAQEVMSSGPMATYEPQPTAVVVYDRLYELYLRLHDAFGVAGTVRPLDDVMKQLLDLRDEARNG